MDSRKHAESLYGMMEVYTKIFQSWFKIMMPLCLLSSSCAILVQLYITVRHVNIPLIIYAIFPTAAVTIMTIVFILSYDVVTVGRIAESKLVELQNPDSEHLVRLFASRKMRSDAVKRARAMRPITLSLGGFAEFSLSVPVYMWEEILNQLVFLLTF